MPQPVYLFAISGSTVGKNYKYNCSAHVFICLILFVHSPTRSFWKCVIVLSLKTQEMLKLSPFDIGKCLNCVFVTITGQMICGDHLGGLVVSRISTYLVTITLGE